MPGEHGPIAWLHGYTMDSSIWGEVWAHLPGRDHLGIDLPGHGSRSSDVLPHDLSVLAEDLVERLREGGARTVVALSFSTCVALQAAIDHPGVIDRLVLGAPTLCGVADDPAARAKYLLLSLTYRSVGPGDLLARQWMADPPDIFTGLRSHPAALERMRATVARHTFAELGTGAMGGLTGTTQGAAQLRRLRIPVLVLSGDLDMPRFRENAHLYAAHAPRASLHRLPGVGHLPFLERPRECAVAIQRFLDHDVVPTGRAQP